MQLCSHSAVFTVFSDVLLFSSRILLKEFHSTVFIVNARICLELKIFLTICSFVNKKTGGFQPFEKIFISVAGEKRRKKSYSLQKLILKLDFPCYFECLFCSFSENLLLAR